MVVFLGNDHLNVLEVDNFSGIRPSKRMDGHTENMGSFPKVLEVSRKRAISVEIKVEEFSRNGETGEVWPASRPVWEGRPEFNGT